MKKNSRLILTAFLLACCTNALHAQFKQTQMGVNTLTPDVSTVLDVESPENNKGVLIPRMTAAQKNAIPSPATGLLVYDTTTNCLSQNTGTPAAPNWICSPTTADNGLTKTADNIQLGGLLTKASTLTTTASNTLAIQGLQTGATTDNIVVTDANGVLKTVTKASIGAGGDNLGNHTATESLKMANNNITGAANTSTQTATIAKGTDNAAAVAGYIATSADAYGNVIWKDPASIAGSSGTEWYLGGTTTDAGANKTGGIYRTGRVGVGNVTNPSTLLDINNGFSNGAIKIVDGTQGDGRVLVSDANGVGTWGTKGLQATQGVVPSAQQGFTAPVSNGNAQLRYTGYYVTVPTGRSTITAGLIGTSSGAGYATCRLSTSSGSFNQPSGVVPNYSAFTILTSISAGNVTWYANNTTGSPQTYYVWITFDGGAKGKVITLGGSIAYGEAYIMVAY
jgi:hypothetical protein